MRRRHLLWLAAVALLPGCTVPPVADPLPTTSLLDQLPTDVPRRAPSAATLVVFPPEARPALDTTQMAYATRPHQIAYYARNQWAETPPQMLQPLLVRTLEATGAFHAVVRPAGTGTATLALRTDITELLQDFTRDTPVLRLGLRVRLSDERTRAVLATREIAIDEPMALKSPDAGVAAANAALAKALRAVAQFALDAAP
jgi:cholesterol transport system auxiliary component